MINIYIEVLTYGICLMHAKSKGENTPAYNAYQVYSAVALAVAIAVATSMVITRSSKGHQRVTKGSSRVRQGVTRGSPGGHWGSVKGHRGVTGGSPGPFPEVKNDNI